MTKKSLKRIAIIGLPGSGKSTFALNLGKLLKLPVYHLDKYVFDGKEKRERKEFLIAKENMVKEPFWIIEGCSLSTLEMRFAHADMVIYFHFSRLCCIWRIIKRLCTFSQQDADTGCLNGINWPLINYMWKFDREKRHSIEELKTRYPKVEFLTFYHSRESNKYLRGLQKNQHSIEF